MKKAYFVELTVVLSGIPEDVRAFCNITNRYPFEVDISCYKRRVVDAKSLLGLYTLDFSKPVTLTIYSSGDEVEDYIASIQKYIRN